MAAANWLDNVIGVFSPSSKLKRIQFKVAAQTYEKEHDNYKRKYEGADRGRRTWGWNTSGTSANSEIKRDLVLLRNRSRDLVRNNPYAERGIRAIATETIGRGIKSQIKIEGNRATRRQKDVQAKWKSWTESTAIDYDGRHNLAGLQNLVLRSVAESGEVIIRRRRPPASLGLEVPLQLQILESDFIDSRKVDSRLPSGNSLIQGIEFDENGRRVSYRIFENHPGSLDIFQKNSFNSNKIPASEILHVYRVDRPGMSRGTPWLSPCLVRLRDLDMFEDAQLVRQKIAASFVAFVHDIDAQQSDLNQECKDELGEKMEPGLIEFLPPGKTVTLANPPGVQNYKEYTSVVLHSIASGLGVPYECLVGDLSEVNYSSGRMGWLQFQRNIDSWRWQILVPQMLNPIFDWFKDSSELVGLSADSAQIEWTPPRREMIDPTKEIPAKIAAIRSGISTLSETLRMEGKDPEVHLQEMKDDNETLDNLQLTLDSDPRKTNGKGALQSVSTPNEEI